MLKLRAKNQKGSVYIEMATAVPILLMLTFYTIQYGMILAAKITLKHASAVAARVAVLDGAEDAAATQAAKDASVGLDNVASDLTVTVSNSTINASPAKTVTLSYDYDLMLPKLVPGSNNGKLTIQAATTMR